MNIKKIFNTLFFISAVLILSSYAAAVTVTGAGSTIIINKIAGFDGVDGAGREAAFVAAAQVWADILVSPVEIVVDASFSSALYCSTFSATLGSAGPLNTYFSGGAESFGLQNNVWYPTALINAKYGSDYFVDSADITAEFNADIGDSDCLSASGWYYGMDGNTPSGYIDFYEVVLHELGHGLGFLSLVNSDGSFPYGNADVYSNHLHDQGSNTAWTALSNSARASSILSSGDLVWSGAQVNSLVGDLTSGVNAGKVQMYAPNPYEGGSSISHFDTALTPNELMEPQYTGGASHDHSVALFKDIGWTIFTNHAPSITGQASLSTDEDTALILSLSDLTVSDSDNTYPNDFTLTVNSGSNYSVSGSTITPSSNFNGTLTVPVIVNDGEDDSASYNLSVTVNSVNDAPVIIGQASLSLNEDNSRTLTTSNLTITDPDDSSFTLTVSSGSNYSVSGNQITPSANYNGTLTVPVTVNDGEDDSASYNVSVTVNAINDAPNITGQTTLSVDEDNSLTLSTSDLTISDVDDSSFTLAVGNGTNYSVSGNQITPSTDYYGALTIPVTVSDGDDDSASYNLSVTVNSINDLPVISGQATLTIDEDSLLTLSMADLTITDPDDSSFTLTVGSGTNYSVSGTEITPTTNYNGTLTVPLTVNDGENDSASYNLSVTVNGINDAPVISAQASLNVAEDNSLTLTTANFTIVDPDDSAFTLAISNGTSYSVSGNQVTPDANFSGTLTVPVTVNDGDADSAVFNATITVLGANDPPVISGQSPLSVDEDQSLEISLTDLTVIDIDNINLSLQLLSGTNYTVSGTTVTPDENYNGTINVPARVFDGTDYSPIVNLNVTVNSVNDIPVISAQESLTVAEDNTLLLTTADFTIVDPDDSAFTLAISNGTSYSVSGNQIIPAVDFNGALTVPVSVSDGEANSATFSATINVSSVNDAPVIANQNLLTVNEDETLQITLADISVTDVDTTSLSLQLLDGNNYSVTDTTITPDENYNGVLAVAARVFDGSDYSATVALSVTVTAVNDQPMLVGTPATVLAYGNSYSTQFTATDVDNNELTFSVSSAHSWLDIDSNGWLTGDPQAGDLGEQSVTVTVSDGQASDNITFNLNVTDSSSSDISVDMRVSEYLYTTGDSAQLIVVIDNNGPSLFTDGTLSLYHSEDSQISTTDSRCITVNATNIDCSYVDLTSTDEYMFTVQHATVGGDTLVAEVSTTKTDTELSNNQAHVTLMFANEIQAPSNVLNFAVNTHTEAAAVADFNRDNALEIWLANDLSTTEQRFNIGTDYNSIHLAGSFAVNQDAQDVLVVDLNNDNIDDIVFANNGANSAYLANTAGGFTSLLSLGSSMSNAVAAGDFNGDNFVDLVFANEGENQLYLNDQTGNFSAAQSLGSADSTDIAVIDYNTDGWLDIIVANSNDDDLVYLNNGLDQTESVFNTSAVLVGLTQTHSQAVAVIDLDNNGVNNGIIIGATTEDGVTGLTVYRINNNVQTVVHQIIAGDVISIAVGDYDGNNQTDVAVVNDNAIVQIYGQTDGVFSVSEAFKAEQATQVLLQTIDADDEADLVVLRGGLVASQVFLSDDSLITSPSEQETTTTQTTESTSTGTTGIKSVSGSLGTVVMFLSLLLLSSRRKRASRRI